MATSMRLPWTGRQGPDRRGARAELASALHIELPGRRGRRPVPARVGPVRVGRPVAGSGLPAFGPASPGGAGADRGRLSRGLRRAADILGSAALLLFTLPVQLAIAVLVRLEGPGPVLCREGRVGLHGRTFPLLSFRSTRADAPLDDPLDAWAGAWAGDPCRAFPDGTADARVTGVGRWLRLARLDELPRLLNVLRGDMSLVGPSPEPSQLAATLSQQLPLYAMRHAVKPGIIGWAQVAGPYGASAADARVRLGYDLYYVLHQGWRLDLRILLAALGIMLRALLRGPGAR